MASLFAGECIDMLDVAFKLQSKAKLFENDLSSRKSTGLLATASTVGLVFTGLPTAELQVVQLRSLEYSEDIEKETVPRRTYALPSPAFNIAVSCDHSLLAVDVVVGGVPFLYIYKVDSFLTNNVQKITEIRISPNENVHCSQILWNPVINNMFALLTESGGLCVYNLQDKGIEFHSIDQSEVAQSACWSPKGKQIVVGFANGKLVQYKQDLKPAKSIPCPSNIVDGPFSVIALQWLSTYQFAAVFLKNEEGSVPALHIINAPKTAPQPTYINYDDICYSQSGPRKTQVFLIYIQQWNMLLMASANSMEVGVLGTSETGETPTWCQWVSTDDSRAELPLTADKQETFPVGFVLETGCTKRLVVDETERPVMPMIHIMSTHGFLLSFTILNSKSNYVDICSPPRPVPTSAQSLFTEPVSTMIEAPPSMKQPIPPPTATSTPQPAKAKSFFAPAESKAATNLFGMGTASTASIFGVGQPASAPPPALSFGMAAPVEAKTSFFGSGSADKPVSSLFTPAAPATSTPAPFSSFGSMAAVKPTVSAQSPLAAPPKEVVQSNKPLITVPPTYSQSTQPTQPPEKPVEPAPKSTVKSEEDDKIIRLMIAEELQTIEKDLKNLLARSKNLNVTIGTSDESSQMIRTLDGLEEWGKDALENTDTLSVDIQQLRLGINDTFQMVAEAKSKFSMYKDANQLQFQEAQAISLTNRRQVSRLNNIQQTNELQVQMIDRQLTAQWADYEDQLKANSRHRMRIPSLEGMYQTLSKLQEIIHTQVIKLGMIKKRIGMKENLKTMRSTKKDCIDSLTDSLISMSIADQVKTETSKLSAAKAQQIRSALRGRKIVQVRPMRPNRPGLNSEVVKEKVLQSEASKKAVAAKKEAAAKPKKTEEPAKVQHPAAPVKTMAPPPAAFTAPPLSAFSPAAFAAPPPQMPTKPIAIAATSAPSFAATSAPSFAASFTGFGQKTTAAPSLFQAPKPTVAVADTPKPMVTMSNPVFGTTATPPTLSFGSINPTATSISFGTANKAAGEPTISFGSMSKPMTGGLSFGAPAQSEEPAKTTAALPPTLSFGSGLTVTAVPKTVPEFSFPSIATDLTTSASTKSAEPKPLFGGFESMTVRPVATTAASQPLLPLPLQAQAQPTASKPEESLSFTMQPPVFKEKQQMVVNPVSIKKTQEEAAPVNPVATVVTSSKNKENTPLLPTPVMPTMTTAAEKQPLLSALLTKPTLEPQNPPTIASQTVVSSADIKKPIATTSSFSFGAAFGAAAVQAPSSTADTSAPSSTTFSFVTPSETTAAPAASTASSFSFASAVEKVAVSEALPGATPADSLFQGFNICSPTSTAAPATSASAGSIFGSTVSFGAKPDSSTTSIFGGGGGGGASTGGFGAPATGGIFGGSTAPATSAPTGFFNSMSVQAPTPGGTSIFSLPKPEQSVFGAATQAAAPFGAQPAQPQAASIFGGGTATNSSPFGASAFSSPTASGGSIFGGGVAPQQPTSGGSLFGSASAFSSPTSGGSVFGNAAPTSGGSIFGGGAANQAPTFGGAPTFGSPTPAFGGQGVFGGSATFGAPPTFGSPTGFGAPALSSPTQGNSLFEQLGASSQGNLFGNLANQNVSADKPVFGGQQFSSWR